MAKKIRARKKSRIEKKARDKKTIADIAARYSILLLASLNNLWIFYFLLAPLTINATAFLLRFIYSAEVYGSLILVEHGFIVNMVRACIAASAYYLFLILNLTTAGIKFRKRVAIFIFNAAVFFLLNIARIAILAVMQVKSFAFFDITHKIFWYGMSTAYVVLIWLLTISIFKIKNIPVYSDFAFLARQAKKKKGK